MRKPTMLARLRRVFYLLFYVLLASPLLAQEGHPAKGTWVGYWGPTEMQTRLVITMDYDGKNVTGVVNPGANAIPIKVARLDITPGTPPSKPGELPGEPTFKVHIEAEAKDAKGSPVTIVADGTMQETGLPNRTITGSWSQTSGGKTVKADFKIRRQ
jgi:hypothetical protein